MKYNLLGKSTLSISRIGFGCMSLDAASTGSEALLRKAFDLGINFFDTADLYQKGLNEEMVGRAFGGMRDKVIIASKAGNQWRADGSGWDWNASKKYILRMAEGSLRRLQTDYIDLFQLHGGTIDDPIDETIEAFEQLQSQGKIRFYGISSIRPNVIREYVRRSHLVSVMMQYSLLDRRPEEESLNLLHAHGIGVLARGSLASGLLVSKPPVPMLGYSAETIEMLANRVKAMSDDQRGPTQTALGFVLHHPAIRSAVVGIRTKDQLEAALRAGELPALKEEEITHMLTGLPVNRYDLHR